MATLTRDDTLTPATAARGGRRSIVESHAISLDPMTRVGGALGVQAEADGSQITDARVAGNFFRGYEAIAVGRDPRDGPVVSSRACGWCGGVHMTTSCIALEMAWGLTPPPMAVAQRDIAQATEAIWVHAANLAVRAGPDYCGRVVAQTTPRIWTLAKNTKAPQAVIHGYETIGDLMEALTPVTGSYWIETVPQGRRVLEMVSLLYGKYPHPSVVAPGTVSTSAYWGTFVNYYSRLYMAVDYVKKVCALWDDLIEFLYEADERFQDLGARPGSFVHAGAWDDVHLDSSYGALDETGQGRLARPGVLIDGELVTNSLSEIHQGIEEHVAHSFYEQVGGGGTDPLGDELPSGHPWFTSKVPQPQRPSAEDRYSWCTAPRWRGEVVETTPLGRLWLTALRTDFPPNQFIETTGHSVRVRVPMNFLPEIVVEWKIPKRVNALERLRADAYGVAFSGLCAAIALLKAFELTRSGETNVSVPFEVPQEETVGVGLWESGRGMNVHWVRTHRGRISNYQIVGPSTWNASPRDASGKPGPLEQALIGSPVIEEPRDGRLTGVDVMRVVHSFDPCMNCATH